MTVSSEAILADIRRRKAAAAEARLTELSQREIQVLTGMSRGQTNRAIASELGLAPDTVSSHARRIYAKIDVQDRAQAVAYGFRSGLLT